MNEDLQTKLKFKRQELADKLRLRVAESESFNHAIETHFTLSCEGQTDSNWLQYYQSLEELLAERKQLQGDINLINRVLNGEIEFTGDRDRLYAMQLSMSEIESQILRFENEKTTVEMAAHHQNRLLELLGEK